LRACGEAAVNAVGAPKPLAMGPHRQKTNARVRSGNCGAVKPQALQPVTSNLSAAHAARPKKTRPLHPLKSHASHDSTHDRRPNVRVPSKVRQSPQILLIRGSRPGPSKGFDRCPRLMEPDTPGCARLSSNTKFEGHSAFPLQTLTHQWLET
jgi:hypothetical protein